jgi:hypothetical protein
LAPVTPGRVGEWTDERRREHADAGARVKQVGVLEWVELASNTVEWRELLQP